jgi:beta-galactosidase
MLETVEHASELPAPRYTFVRVSLTQMGVGGDDSWGARPLPEYIPTAERPIHFEVEFRQL